jgi:sestrin
MGSFKDVDTSLFRNAVWNYIQSLFGVKYDDYDYSQIKCLLKSPLRKYIRLVCVAPERIRKRHYESIMREFTHSEKVHVNIVIMQARIQASMLYFLSAINSYFG